MSRPVDLSTTSLRGPLVPLRGLAPAQKTDPGTEFAASLKQQLQQVNQLQNDADENVQKLMTGDAAGVTDVFIAARKAQVAFSLLMEIRNKLVDAYNELQNMRV
jgi:flagellar hook-basal body complex protein FliE